MALQKDAQIRALTVFFSFGAGCGLDLLLAIALGYRAAFGVEFDGDGLHSAFVRKKHAVQELFNAHPDLFLCAELDLCRCEKCHRGFDRGRRAAAATLCASVYSCDIASVCNIPRFLRRYR